MSEAKPHTFGGAIAHAFEAAETAGEIAEECGPTETFRTYVDLSEQWRKIADTIAQAKGWR